MTDPQVTKLSSVPGDSPTTQYNNNKIAGRDCERTARPKLPITDPRSLSQICNIFCYVSKVVSYPDVLFKKQRLQRLGSVTVYILVACLKLTSVYRACGVFSDL